MDKFLFSSLMIYELIVNHPFIFGCFVVGLFIFFWNVHRNCPVVPSDNLNF